MPSAQFELALTATGYINKHGEPAVGLERAGAKSAIRLRSALLDSRIGLEADAVFTVQGSPAAIFKDAAAKPPTDLEIKHWHEAAWNLGVAPLLWIITPTEVRLYDCYASRHRDIADFLAGINNNEPLTPNSATKALHAAHIGVLLLYPVRERDTDEVSIGYELFFPPNAMPYDTGFTVCRRSDEIVVEEGVS